MFTDFAGVGAGAGVVLAGGGDSVGDGRRGAAKGEDAGGGATGDFNPRDDLGTSGAADLVTADDGVVTGEVSDATVTGASIVVADGGGVVAKVFVSTGAVALGEPRIATTAVRTIPKSTSAAATPTIHPAPPFRRAGTGPPT